MGNSSVDPDFRLRAIAECSADWQFWVREDGSIEHMSEACERISGYSREEFLSGAVRLRDYVHPDDYPAMREEYGKAVSGRSGQDLEFRIRRKDGTIRWGSLSFDPVRDSSGRFLGFRGSIRDLTELRNTIESGRRERDLMDKVVSSIGAGLAIVDGSYRIVWYNSVYRETFGPLDENRGKCCHVVFENSPAPCPGCPVREALASCLPVGRDRIGVRLPGGRVRDFHITATPIRNPDGTCDQGLELVSDITESRTRQEENDALLQQLVQARKMEAVGTLAGGIAHEFNNLLTAILGFASILQMQASPGTPQWKSLKMIEKSARRAAELTNQLLGFARKGPRDIREISVNETAAPVLSIVRHTFDRAVAIEEDLFPGLWTIDGDSGQLEQILLNLCINARDAMPSGGTLSVRTRNVELESPRPLLAGSLTQGRWVRLTVTDTGTGIPEEILERIFEPFFTTKEPGKGTGMGLSLVYGIVQSHGGGIDVESSPDSGTSFHVYFPAKKRNP